VRSWAAQRRLVFRFVGLLALCTFGFNLWFFLGIAKSDFFQSYLQLNAESSARVLRFLGDDVSALGTTISSSRFSVDIQRGCEAIQVSAFFIFAVLAWPLPVTRLRRTAGLIVGSLLLLVLNLVRIISLYFTGIYFPGAFEIMHIDVWQPVFIILAVLIWVCWLRWASRTPAVKPHALR